jgi:hypothetical protein
MHFKRAGDIDPNCLLFTLGIVYFVVLYMNMLNKIQVTLTAMIQTTRYYYYRKQWQWQWFKALYELRRSPRLWQQTFIKALTELGLQQGTEDSCVFFSNEYYIFLLVLIEKEEPTLKRDYVRHVDIHHHWVRQESQNNNNIHVQWTPTSQMPANGLTKALHSISETQSCTPKPQVPLQQSW